MRCPGLVRAGALAVLALLAACNSTPLVVHATAAPPEGLRALPAAGSPAACTLRLDAWADERTDPAILGYVAGRPVHSPEDGRGWALGVLSAGLERRGVHLALPGDELRQGPQVGARARLVTAWVSSVAESKTSNIVLAVAFEDAADHDAIYRGARAVGNWDSGDGEIQRMVDAAFNQLLDHLATDVRSHCSPRG